MNASRGFNCPLNRVDNSKDVYVYERQDCNSCASSCDIECDFYFLKFYLSGLIVL